MPKKNPATTEQILTSPEFVELLSRRRRLALPITVSSIIAYFGFILLIAFDPAALAQTIGDGKVSIGIYAGLALLLFSFLLTGIYFRLSNGRIAELLRIINEKF